MKSCPWMPLALRSGHPTVQALASQGGEIALDDTLLFDIACSNPLMMSPSLRGSDPYPCGSLTYRTSFDFFFYIMTNQYHCQHESGGNHDFLHKLLLEQTLHGIPGYDMIKKNGSLCRCGPGRRATGKTACRGAAGCGIINPYENHVSGVIRPGEGEHRWASTTDTERRCGSGL